MERDDHAYADFHHCKHFNSHAHVERDLGQQTSVADTKISTHTLTWSVTCLLRHCRVALCKFQLTRSRGAWHDISFSTFRGSENFNSHAHVERDATLMLNSGFSMNFNSHAHVERDCCHKPERDNYSYFNSHAHVERDLVSRGKFLNSERFQLTRSRGAWRKACCRKYR